MMFINLNNENHDVLHFEDKQYKLVLKLIRNGVRY
jgi:hypothetical protein